MLPRYQAIGTLVSLAFVIGLLGACGPKPEPPQVGEISVEPSTTILVDESVSLTITALGTDDLQFKWTASSGSLSDPTAPSVIYTAPGSSGPVVVTVEVSSEGGTTVQSITLEVVVPEVVVPPTPTPTSTPTSIPTPTPTETPTVAPTPTERPTPTATNIVVLPSPTATPSCTTSGNGGTETISVGSQRISGIHIDLIKRALTEYAGFSLWEVEIYGPATGNLALVEGVIATASTWQDAHGCYGCDPSKAIDDDIGTRWSSDFMEPQWLEIALPAPRVADHIVLRWEAAYAEEYCVTLIE